MQFIQNHLTALIIFAILMFLPAIALARYLFQSHRNKGRVCSCCKSNRHLKRWHEQEFIKDLGKSYILDSTTVQVCASETCKDKGSRDEVKGYPIRVNVGLNFRHFRYRHLLRKHRRQERQALRTRFA